MQNFIVLGIIPGTSVQLNFNFWLTLSIFLAVIPLLIGAWRRRNRVYSYVIALRISRVIDQYQLLA
jgi:uncharacterized membrane protein